MYILSVYYIFFNPIFFRFLSYIYYVDGEYFSIASKL